MSKRVHFNQHRRARALPPPPPAKRSLGKRLSALGWGLLMLICVTGLWQQTDRQIASATTTSVEIPDGYYVQQRLDKLHQRIALFEDEQAQRKVHIDSATKIQMSLNNIYSEFADNRNRQASSDIEVLSKQIEAWSKNMVVLSAKATPRVAAVSSTAPIVHVPILLYHDTPPNFEAILAHLASAGYTAVDLDQVAAAIRGGVALPAKPVVLTFDDGFSSQLIAYRLLATYHMKSTYYIINGGAASNWCIGAARRYDQGQPCGDGYMNWDQIREIDKDPLVTIAAHTLNHSNLAGLSAEMQQAEIFQSKADIESQLGHPIRHFAYPYGSFNQTTIDFVKAAGFSTAVSTLPGTEHSLYSIYTLHRVRDAMALP